MPPITSTRTSSRMTTPYSRPSKSSSTMNGRPGLHCLPDSDPAVQKRILDFERDFCHAMRSCASDEHWDEMDQRLVAMRKELLGRRDLSEDTMRLARSVIHNASTYTSCMATFRNQCEGEVEKFKASALSSLRSRARQADGKTRNRALSGRLVETSEGSGIVNYDAWRRWILGHLDNPYPSADDKVALLKEIPHLSVPQLNTWFSNTRRRCGWSDFYKRHAESSMDRMKELVEAVDSGNPRHSVASEAREGLEKIRHYLESEGRDKVASWVDEVLSKHGVTTPSPCKPLGTTRPRTNSASSPTSSSSRYPSSTNVATPSTSPPRSSSPSSIAASPPPPYHAPSLFVASSRSASRGGRSDSISSISSLGIGFPPVNPSRSTLSAPSHLSSTLSPPPFDFATLPPPCYVGSPASQNPAGIPSFEWDPLMNSYFPSSLAFPPSSDVGITDRACWD